MTLMQDETYFHHFCYIMELKVTLARKRKLGASKILYCLLKYLVEILVGHKKVGENFGRSKKSRRKFSSDKNSRSKIGPEEILVRGQKFSHLSPTFFQPIRYTIRPTRIPVNIGHSLIVKNIGTEKGKMGFSEDNKDGFSGPPWEHKMALFRIFLCVNFRILNSSNPKSKKASIHRFTIGKAYHL